MFKKIFIIFITIVIFIFIGVVYYKNEIKKQKINDIMDQVTLTFDSELKSHRMDDLEIALVLSKNKGIVDALENDDEDLGHEILFDITSTIKNNTDILIRAQIITKELNIFARSWDDIYAGVPIGDYRDDLKYFNTHKTPRTSIEIGRRLGLKSTVPIYNNGVFLGFIEVISFFKSITDFFASMGVDIYVLLDVKYSDSAVLMRENLTIANYIVSNRNYNYSHIQTLNSIDFKELKLSQVVYLDNKYLFYKTMYDGNFKSIGAFVFVLPERYLEYFRNPEDDISFLINVTRSSLYDVLKEEKYAQNIYDNYSASAMVYLQNVIDKEDRQIFFDEAYEKFDKYSKDELIQMMLERKVVKKINGKIK
ncbi:cache domain-containing protein [Sulfurimonas sp.]|uniref:cache domain-containing protein n=1 Tax=Sulfurimonas sp. TaxID=2022749 RepID=UPI002B4889B4|nr:cache domain-containing protein [Sulfurimonas sp.]